MIKLSLTLVANLPSRPKPCKYECGTTILWDETAAMFVEPMNGGAPHTQEKCKSIKAQKGIVSSPASSPAMTFEPILKQNVGSSNSILLELAQSTKNEVETQNTILEKILEQVMQKATSNNISVASQGSQIDKVAKQLSNLYELVELTAAQVQEIRTHLKISSFQSGSDLHRTNQQQQQRAEQATQEDYDEMAGTDDLTQIDSHSINHAVEQDD